MTDGSCNSGDDVIAVSPALFRLGEQMRAAAESAYGPVKTKRETEQRDAAVRAACAAALMLDMHHAMEADGVVAGPPTGDDRADGPGASEAYIRRWLAEDVHLTAPAHEFISSWLVDGLRAVVADLDQQRALVSDAEDLALHHTCDSCGAPRAQGPCSAHCDRDE